METAEAPILSENSALWWPEMSFRQTFKVNIYLGHSVSSNAFKLVYSQKCRNMN